MATGAAAPSWRPALQGISDCFNRCLRAQGAGRGAGLAKLSAKLELHVQQLFLTSRCRAATPGLPQHVCVQHAVDETEAARGLAHDLLAYGVVAEAGRVLRLAAERGASGFAAGGCVEVAQKSQYERFAWGALIVLATAGDAVAMIFMGLRTGTLQQRDADSFLSTADRLLQQLSEPHVAAAVAAVVRAYRQGWHADTAQPASPNEAFSASRTQARKQQRIGQQQGPLQRGKSLYDSSIGLMSLCFASRYTYDLCGCTLRVCVGGQDGGLRDLVNASASRLLGGTAPALRLAAALEGSELLEEMSAAVLGLPEPPRSAPSAAHALATPAPWVYLQELTRGSFEICADTERALQTLVASTANAVSHVATLAKLFAASAQEGPPIAPQLPLRRPPPPPLALQLGRLLLSPRVQELQRCLLERFVRDHAGGCAGDGDGSGGGFSGPLQTGFGLAVQAAGGGGGRDALGHRAVNIVHLTLLQPAIYSWEAFWELGLCGGDRNVAANSGAGSNACIPATSGMSDERAHQVQQRPSHTTPPPPSPPSALEVCNALTSAMLALERAYSNGATTTATVAAARSASLASYPLSCDLQLAAGALSVYLLRDAASERPRGYHRAEAMGALAATLAVSVQMAETGRTALTFAKDTAAALSMPDIMDQEIELKRKALANAAMLLTGLAAGSAWPLTAAFRERLSPSERIGLARRLVRARWLRTLDHCLRLLAEADVEVGIDNRWIATMLDLAKAVPEPLQAAAEEAGPATAFGYGGTSAGGDRAATAPQGPQMLPRSDFVAQDLSGLLLTAGKLASVLGLRLETVAARAVEHQRRQRLKQQQRQQQRGLTRQMRPLPPRLKREFQLALQGCDAALSLLFSCIACAENATTWAPLLDGSNVGAGAGAVVAANAAKLRGAAAVAACAALRAAAAFVDTAPLTPDDHGEGHNGTEGAVRGALRVARLSVQLIVSPLAEWLKPPHNLRAALPEHLIGASCRLLVQQLQLQPVAPAPAASGDDPAPGIAEAVRAVLSALLALLCHEAHAKDVITWLGPVRSGDASGTKSGATAGGEGGDAEAARLTLAADVTALAERLAALGFQSEAESFAMLQAAAVGPVGHQLAPAGGSRGPDGQEQGGNGADGEGVRALQACARSLMGQLQLPECQAQGPVTLPRVCGSPGCDNFGGASEAQLRLRQCAGCRAVRYCSAECQRQHWREGHREECQRG